MSRRNSAIRTLVLGVCATLVTGAVVAPGAGAADKPLAQSVGRFLDGSVGGKPIQQLADLKDARAVNPGTTSAQNPLDATLLGKLEVPLSGALQLPGGGVFKLGAVNQVAVAKSDGYSYGASGAVSNSGGISLGGTTEFPADATIDLSSASLGSVPIPPLSGLPATNATTNPAALGGVSATIGAVSGLAQTKAGGDPVTPQYQIAGLSLKLGSPALGALLNELAAGGDTLKGVLGTIADKLSNLLPSACTSALVNPPLTTIEFPTSGADEGAITIDPAQATVTLDLAKLLDDLGLNLNKLPANTDLLGAVVGQLPALVAAALASVVSGMTSTLIHLGGKCVTALKTIPGLGQILKALTKGEKTFVTQLKAVAAQLTSASAPGIAELFSSLAQVLAIGVNVESGPGKAPDNPTYKFTSKLNATPDQATPVVSGQTLVRAIEIDLLGGQAAVLALGNAAAGPSSPAVAPPSSSTPASPTSTPPLTAIPTGVPAGQANVGGGTPTLPLVLLIVGLLMAAGGAVTWRLRGGRHLG